MELAPVHTGSQCLGGWPGDSALLRADPRSGTAIEVRFYLPEHRPKRLEALGEMSLSRQDRFMKCS